MSVLLSAVVPLLAAAPEDDDVVAGWTAFVVFVLLILAVVVLGFSLTKRLKNVDKAEEAGLYDPSDRTPRSDRPARGLAAARQRRDPTAADEPTGEQTEAGNQTGEQP